MNKVKVSTLAKKMEMENLTESLDLDEFYITVPDINRPSLQFAGFWDFYEPTRVQIVGKVEYVYLQKMDPKERTQMYHDFMEKGAPCIIFARSAKSVVDLISLMKAS